MAVGTLAVGVIPLSVSAAVTLLADVLRLAAALVSNISGLGSCGLPRARPVGCVMAGNVSSFSKLYVCCLFAKQLVSTR